LRDRPVGHPADDGFHQPGAFLRVSGRGQQPHQRVGRELADAARHVVEHLFEPIGVVLGNRIDDAAQQAEERSGLCGEAAAQSVGPPLEGRHQLGQLAGVAGDAEELADRVFVEPERLALQTARDDRIPDRRLTGAAFAEHLRIVDLAQRQMEAGHRRPEARDAALGADRFGRPREEQQELLPGVCVPSWPHRDLANQVRMQQLGELADRRVGPRRRPAVHQQAVRQHRQRDGRGKLRRRRDVHDAPHGCADCRVPGRVEDDGARGGFAGAREFRDPRRVVGCQRRRLFAHVRHITER
jgi:hypothetical protein